MDYIRLAQDRDHLWPFGNNLIDHLKLIYYYGAPQIIRFKY
jgi:hypothetical protein